MDSVPARFLFCHNNVFTSMTRRPVVPRSTSQAAGAHQGAEFCRALAAAKTGRPRLGARRRNSSTSRRTATSARISQKVRSQRLLQGVLCGVRRRQHLDRSAPALAPPITWENFRPGTSTPASEFGSTISRRSSGRPSGHGGTSSSPAGLLIACQEL